MGVAHVLVLIALSLAMRTKPEPETPAPRVQPTSYDVRLPDRRPPAARERQRKPDLARPPVSQPGPSIAEAASRTTPHAVLAPPSSPDYGRWAVAPSPGGGSARGLQGCAPQTLAKLSGRAYDACARRLAEAGRAASGLPPPTSYAPDQAEAAYRNAVKAWRASPWDMSPHPCPPDNSPAHRLVVDKCSLVNAARHDDGSNGISLGRETVGVEVRFKYKF